MSNNNKYKSAEAVMLEKESVVAPSKSIAFDQVGYSIMERDNKWHLVEIKYDALTLTPGYAKIISTDDSQIEIEEQMKIKIAENLFK